MSERATGFLLEDILASIEKINRYTAGYTLQSFLEDDKTQDAVIRNFEIIGEAVHRIPDEFKSMHTDIPWFQIRGLRNRVVHDYLGVDLELIWQILEHDLPPLKSKISKII